MDALDGNNEPWRKRLRTSHACDICRSRKIRCDGNQPCHACVSSKQECCYGSEANTRGKSDLILEGVLRVEQLLNDMRLHASPLSSPTRSFQALPPASSTSQQSLATAEDTRPNTHLNLENAILDSLHNSTTESILSWPYFDAFPTIRQNFVSTFQLEQSRPGLAVKAVTLGPDCFGAELDSILDSFQRTINFWFPTMSLAQLEVVRHATQGAHNNPNALTDCCWRLVLALGCAGQAMSGGMYQEDVSASREELQFKREQREMADMHFDGAWKMIHYVHSEMSCMAVQCLFFTALYFAYQRRPLQAWNYIHDTATKCLLLLSYPPASEPMENQECLRRIFWSCYNLESDYLAELSALPQSGIARIESSISLPGTYRTHENNDQNEHASLYFMACISVRRLLNRVHQLLYARDSGAAPDIARFPAIVAELDHQLDEWRNVLPRAFHFSLGRDREQPNECSGFLRQRYFACKSVLYRPYLAWLLANGQNDVEIGILSKSEIAERARVCVDSCTSHILGLTGFAHTVLVDTWICVLSMATAMMILLATCHSVRTMTRLRHDIMDTGPHLRKVFRKWQEMQPSPESPSVEQGLRIIQETETLMLSLGRAPNMSDEEGDIAAVMCAMARE